MQEVVHVIKKWDLATVSEKTRLPVRTLRYVIDQDIVPGLRVDREGRGNARSLSRFDATVLAAAAALLNMGWPAIHVKEVMKSYKGAKRSAQICSFWKGLEMGRTNWYWKRGFAHITISVGHIYSLLEGGTDES